MAEEKNKVLQKARIEMNYLTGDAEVRRLAELREKWEMDRISDLSYAEQQGEKRGRKLGKAEGEKAKAIEIAKEMLKQGLNIDLIMSITKLSKTEIESLK